MAMEIKLGSKVRILESASAIHAGEIGTVTDLLYGVTGSTNYVDVLLDKDIKHVYAENEVEVVAETREQKDTYRVEVETLKDLVIAKLVEIDEYGGETVVSRTHGHILHDGVRGVLQATDFATRRLFNNVCPMAEKPERGNG